MSDRSKPPHSPEPELDAESPMNAPSPTEEHEPSADELVLAEALARALDAGGSAGQSDQKLGGLLEAATLVKASRHFELSEERKQSLRSDFDQAVLAHAERKAPSKQRGVGFWLRFPLLAAGLAALALVLRFNARSEAPAEVAVTASPSAAAPLDDRRLAGERLIDQPPAALVQAQAEALSLAVRPGEARSAERAPLDSDSRAKLDHELKAYRFRLMASLDERLR